jgi:polyisoprenoid-binding protein YceI
MKYFLLACAAAALAACSQKHPTEATSSSDASTSVPAPAPVNVPAGAYTLDKSHASLIFRVDHVGFSNYTGKFRTFDAELQFDPANFAASSVTVKIDPRSLDVDNPPAGFVDSLLGKDWLDAGRFPEMTFKSTNVETIAPGKARITGDFTLHGVTKPVVLDATFNGGYASHPMDPRARIGFSANGKFKRSDFGITYGIPEPGSKMGVSDQVDTVIEVEFSGPPAAADAEKK